MKQVTLWTLLEFGTLWFWILTAIVVGFLVYYTESEDDNGNANIGIALGLVALYFFGNKNFFNELGQSILNNPWNAVGLFAMYIILGSVWSVIKWFFYLKKERMKILERQKIYSYSTPQFNIEDYSIGKNKVRIMSWMLYWPVSGLWTLINDPFKKAFEYIIEHFGKFYDKMVFKILGDLVKKPENGK